MVVKGQPTLPFCLATVSWGFGLRSSALLSTRAASSIEPSFSTLPRSVEGLIALGFTLFLFDLFKATLKSIGLFVI